MLAVTYPAVIVNGAETVEFAATATEDGTAATDGLELDRLTVMPPEGAMAVRFTRFPAVDKPLTTLVCDSTTELGTAGFTARIASATDPLTPVRLAKRVTVVWEATTAELIAKLEETVAPAATLTDAGTEARLGFDEDRLKTSPPAGAGRASVNVFEDSTTPPNTDGAARVKATAIGFTVRTTVALAPFTLAIRVTGVLPDTPVVVIVKADETVAPAATGTEAGTDATAVLELDKRTAHPPAGAGLLSTTVLVAVELPPTTGF